VAVAAGGLAAAGLGTAAPALAGRAGGTPDFSLLTVGSGGDLTAARSPAIVR
jgi:hypothetical protein